MLDKLFFILFCLLLSVSNVSSQNRFQGGIVAGLSATQVHGDTYSGFNKAGLYAGGIVKRNLSETWIAQLELVYIQKGSRKNPDPSNGDYVLYLLRVNYVEAPLLIKCNYKKFSFEIGASYGVLINSHEENQFGTVNNLIPLQRSDISFLYGGNINLNEHLTVNIRNSNSIFPIRKFDTPIYYQRRLSNMFNKGMYNTVMLIALQYQF